MFYHNSLHYYYFDIKLVLRISEPNNTYTENKIVTAMVED
jgi:hypothetical protein